VSAGSPSRYSSAAPGPHNNKSLEGLCLPGLTPVQRPSRAPRSCANSAACRRCRASLEVSFPFSVTLHAVVFRRPAVSCVLRSTWFPHQALTFTAFVPPSRCCIRPVVIFRTTLTLGICRDWAASSMLPSPKPSHRFVLQGVSLCPRSTGSSPAFPLSAFLYVALVICRSSAVCGIAAPPGGASYRVRTQRGAYCSAVWADTLERFTSKASVDSDAMVVAWPLSCFAVLWRRLQADAVSARRHPSGSRIEDVLSRYRAVDLPCFGPVAPLHVCSEKQSFCCDTRRVGACELMLALAGMRGATLSTAPCPPQSPTVAPQVAGRCHHRVAFPWVGGVGRGPGRPAPSRDLSRCFRMSAAGKCVVRRTRRYSVNHSLAAAVYPPRRVKNDVFSAVWLSPAALSSRAPRWLPQSPSALTSRCALRVGRPFELAFSLRDGSNHFKPSAPRRRVAYACVVVLRLAYLSYRLCVPRSLLGVCRAVSLEPKLKRPSQSPSRVSDKRPRSHRIAKR